MYLWISGKWIFQPRRFIYVLKNASRDPAYCDGWIDREYFCNISTRSTRRDVLSRNSVFVSCRLPLKYSTWKPFNFNLNPLKLCFTDTHKSTVIWRNNCRWYMDQAFMQIFKGTWTVSITGRFRREIYFLLNSSTWNEQYSLTLINLNLVRTIFVFNFNPLHSEFYFSFLTSSSQRF